MQTLRRSLTHVTLQGILIWFTFLLWALWFGASIATIVFVTHFFSSMPRPAAADAASAMFHAFGNYGLALAGIMILVTGAMVVVRPSRGAVVLLGGLILAGGMAVTFSLGLIPRMESLRADGLSQGTEFQALHKKSSRLISMQTGLLLILGAGMGVMVQSSETKSGAGEESSESMPTATLDTLRTS